MSDAPVEKTTVEVRELFRSVRVGMIAGCIVRSGAIRTASSGGRVSRTLWPGDECGVLVDRSVKVGDVIEVEG